LNRRPDFLEVGKFAIAYCLMPFEDEAKLYQPTGARGGDWYEYLTTKLDAPFEQFGENKLSIITFNYDRSLEHYMLTALQNLHGRSFEECANKLARIPIIHVYGQLGKDPYPRPNCHPYRPERDRYASIVRAAAGITLLHEKASQLQEAQELLRAARRICFLGFGYHPLNVERLTISSDAIGSKNVFGTAKGFRGRELTAVDAQIAVAIGSKIQLSNVDNLEILREHLVLE
jgi:hypothetical protein